MKYICLPFIQLIRFFLSTNLVVSGLRIQNSPQFHMKFDGCEGVLIDKLSISSPKLSPNTDGIHIENTKYVGIYNSVIANGNQIKSHKSCFYQLRNFFLCALINIFNNVTLILPGDDCISIGTGCSNVEIDSVTCGPSHGIRYIKTCFIFHRY